MKKKMDEKGQFTEMWLWAIVALMLVLWFGFLSPIMQNITAGMYRGAEPVIDNTQSIINTYTDTNLRTSASEVITMQKNSVGTNLQIYGSLYTYGALLTIIIIFIGYWLITKKKVIEAGAGGIVG